MAPRIFAVCIGIDFYPNSVSLSGAVGDCDSFISYLTEVLSVPATQIKRLTSTKDGHSNRAVERNTDNIATYENITNALLKLSKECREGDQVLITYSGHGNRVWSIVPDWRGKETRMDETLAPMDAFISGGRELRDFELSYLLNKIVETKCKLTVVLDSCYSGGAFRDPDPRQQEAFLTSGLRARYTIFKTMAQKLSPQETKNLEAEKQKYHLDRPLGRVTTGGEVVPGVSLEDLQNHWNTMQDRTENVPRHQWLVKPFGYEIWTGCLAHELSWEINGGGRLTSALVDTLRIARNINETSLGMVFRNVFDRVYGKREYVLTNEYEQVTHREPMLQTPVLLGDVGRGFLSNNTAAEQVVGIPISAIPFGNSHLTFKPFDTDEQNDDLPTLILRAGSAHGVQQGSEYAVYLWDDNLNTPPSEAQVRVVITEVGTIASVVRVVGSPDMTLFKNVSKEQHIRASNLMKAYYDKFPDWFKVNKMPPQDITYPWPSGCQAVLVAGPSANVKYVRLMTAGGSSIPSPWHGKRNTYVRAEIPLLVVSEDSTPVREDFQVRYSDGKYAVYDGGSSGALLAQADGMDKALRDIIQISQYRTWLDNVRTTTDFENTDLFTLKQTERAPVEGETSVEKIGLKFSTNLEYISEYNKLHVNMALFHFSPNFGVRQIYPQQGQFESVDIGHFREITFKRKIPQGGAGMDVVKAVVYQSSTGFKSWELPELGAEGEVGQPVRQRAELVLTEPAPKVLAELDPVPGTRGDDLPAVNDGERAGYEKYWLLQVTIRDV
ncbi:caspase domain-containing protein [Terfezia claveryi]|nr:caspase domain-containing protein [Terfezia claveryi]